MYKKVKIKKLPQAKTGMQVQGSLYNQPAAMGGADIDQNMSKPNPTVSKTLTSVPRHEANLEAEGGETAYGDINGDGFPEHYNIKGPKHSNGGVPLSLPKDTFIFSDTKDMRIKDPNILKMFSKNKGSYTPAELSKQYDINKYRKILEDPNSDKLDVKTAELMIRNYNMKLGGLALAQEAKKGFPQGIPDMSIPYLQSNGIAPEQLMPSVPSFQPSQPMMKYGGNYYAENGLQIIPYEEAKTQAGNITPTGKSNKYSARQQALKDYLLQWEPLIPNISKLSEGQAQSAIYDWSLKNNPDAIRAMWKEFGITAKGKKSKDLMSLTKDNSGTFTDDQLTDENLAKLKEAYVDNYFGVRQLDPINTPKPNTPVDNPPVDTPKDTKIPYTEKEKAPPAERNPLEILDFEQPIEPPVEWSPQAKREFNNALKGKYSRQKQYSWAAQFMPTYPEPTYLDPTRAIAAQAELANILSQGFGQFVGPQAGISRALGIQGQLAKQAADTIANVYNQNVGTANQFELNEAQIANQAQLQRQAVAKQLYDQTNYMKDQYRKEGLAWDQALVNIANEADRNAVSRYNLSKMTDQYDVLPDGRIVFTGGKQITPERSTTFDDYLMHYKEMGMGDKEAIQAAKIAMGNTGGYSGPDLESVLGMKYGGMLGYNTFPFMF